MWIFLNNSFLSIVQHRNKPEHLMVRARAAGDIETVFPAAKVSRTPDADYLYRATILKSDVAEEMAEQIHNISYPNFKNSITDPFYRRTCGNVWSNMFHHQHQLED